ncbi:TonB-dependent receptor [Peristeroidobacter agariperforans]|uniref:TonB-dependent receptor n=1 Tax=Peristeroidobacter agariperforans TaxID=268404 RepID=UPI001300B3CE|nr:TonB-dependent receptor [Peristeroidobacter agariperforans]
MRKGSKRGLAHWAVRSAAAAALTTTAATQVTAQEVEEVVVTGFRQSLNKALDVKREEIAAVDSIVAEDIADFPDLNLAEAIQRIPGVTINREGGQGRTITVRGLGGDFTRTNINGMETVAGSTGNRGRGFDFNVFASELFQSIVVRKTQTADLDEGSLGATVDLQTARPFDYQGFRTALSGQASFNDVTENTNPRAAGLISWSNDDRTFGALFSAAYSERNPFDEGFGTTRWGDNGQAIIDRTPGSTSNPTGNFGSCLPCASPDEFTAVNEGFHPRIPRYAESLLEQKRYGLTAALQWAPTEKTLLNFDALYAYYSSQTENANAGSISFSRTNATGINETVVRDYALEGDNLVYGVFDNVDLRSENGFERHITKYHQFTLSGTHEFSDTFRLRALVGTSENDLDTPYNFSFAYDALNVDGYTYDFRNGQDRMPYLVHGIDMTNPALWTLTEARRRESSVVNSYDTGKFSLEFDVTDGLTLKGGALAKKFEVDMQDFSSGGALAADRRLVGVGSIARNLPVGRDLNIPAGSDRNYIVPDVWKSAGYVGLFTDPTYALTVSTGDTRNVSEEDASAFLAVDFEYDVFDMPLRGTTGVRYAQTEVTSTGILNRTGVGNEVVRVDNEYTDTLPSLNLVLEPSQDFLVRFGAAKVMARPSLGDLTPGGTVNVGSRTVSFGNPLLDPFRATNYDLGAEWYFKDEALLALGLFYKDIKSFSVKETRGLPFTETGLPIDLLAGIDPATAFEVTRNINGEGGWIRGLEFQYQQPFSFLPGAWSNFGFIGNYTYIESSVKYGVDPNGHGIRNDLLNLSRNTYNLTLYYETQKFSARVSSAFRGKYLTAFPGGNGTTEEGVNDATNIDASVSYNVTDTLTVSLEGINLTDEYTDSYVDQDNLVSRYRHTGRELLLGVRWTY